MKSFPWILALLLGPLLPLLHAQPAATNYVLSLGGTNGFLELPGSAFNDLEDVTIEGWVKLLEGGYWSVSSILAKEGASSM